MIKSTKEAIKLLEDYFPNKRKLCRVIRKNGQELMNATYEIADSKVDIWGCALNEWSREAYDLVIEDLIQNTYQKLPKYFLLKAIAYAQCLTNKHMISQAINEYQEE